MVVVPAVVPMGLAAVPLRPVVVTAGSVVIVVGAAIGGHRVLVPVSKVVAVRAVRSGSALWCLGTPALA